MNKKQLVDAVAIASDLPKNTVIEVLDNALEVIQAAVASGDKVALPGFGAFDLVYKPAQTRTAFGKQVEVAESWKPRFRPSSGFVGLAFIAQKSGAK